MDVGHFSIFFPILSVVSGEWPLAMQEVAKSSPSTIEGPMMVVNSV